MATLTEIETNWSLTDLLDANEALDLDLEARRHAEEKQAKAAR
jgi:hypothetical protein